MSHFTAPPEKNLALFEHIISTFGEGSQIVKASEEYAEVAGWQALARCTTP